MEFEQQLESMQQQFGDLKRFVAHMMEEHQTLQTENLHLRKRLEELLSKEQPSIKHKKKGNSLDIGKDTITWLVFIMKGSMFVMFILEAHVKVRIACFVYHF